MIKNKKGFTLVEVIAVVVIIALLAGISIPLVSKYMNESKIKYNEELEKEFLTIVKDYYADNPEELPRGSNFRKSVSINELQAKNYLSGVLANADGESCDESVGYVTLDDNGELKYDVCLKCGKFIVGDALCNDYSYDKCLEQGELSVSSNLYYENDGEEEEYEKGIVTDSVILKVSSNKSGVLQFNGKTYYPDDAASVEGVYVYHITITESMKSDDSFYIIDNCFNKKSEKIGVDIAITPNVVISGENRYIVEPNETVTFKHNLNFSNISNLKYYYYNNVNDLTSGTISSNGDIGYSGVDKYGTYNLRVCDGKNESCNATNELSSVTILVFNKIVFDLAGGVGDFEDIEFNSDVNLPDSAPVKEGYVFVGWKDSYGNLYEFNDDGIMDNYTMAKSTKLTAQWEKEIFPDENESDDKAWVNIVFHCYNNTHTKKYYEGNNSSFVACNQNNINDKYDIKTGHIQSGWSNSSSGGTIWNSSIPVKDYWIKERNGKTINLYATWEPKKVEVEFVCSTSSSSNPKQTFTYNPLREYKESVGNFSKKCSKTGYILDGWSKLSGGSKDYAIDNVVWNSWVDANYSSIKLYPVWKVKTVKVKFVCSSSSVLTQTFKYNPNGSYAIDTSIGKVTGFTKKCSSTGLEQKGWSENKGGVWKYRTDSFVSNDWLISNSPEISLYPVWHLVQTTTDKCSYDKVAPVCELISSCKKRGAGVEASFRCMDASSSVTIYSVFAQQGWKEDRFNSVDKITDAMSSKGTASKGNWASVTSWWNTNYSGNKPIQGVPYTFYYAAIDACGNRVVFDNETSSCKW